MTAAVPTLAGSRDPGTGQVYVGPRRFAADGSLRPCEPVLVPARGTLYSWTVHRGTGYGLIDLDAPYDSVRIEVRLGDGPYEIGARYHGEAESDEATITEVRFCRD
ncbi:hypothetical protein [Streptomyces sp. NPDC046805]|uniref:hypothetical protein n=1 Tax=Streptomyces sp. NPDC046805 TaxID=3155134 RepID=UPI0033F3886B